jgi:hypothetical protein
MGNAAGVVDYGNVRPPPLTGPQLHRIHSSSLLQTPPSSPLPDRESSGSGREGSGSVDGGSDTGGGFFIDGDSDDSSGATGRSRSNSGSSAAAAAAVEAVVAAAASAGTGGGGSSLAPSKAGGRKPGIRQMKQPSSGSAVAEPKGGGTAELGAGPLHLRPARQFAQRGGHHPAAAAAAAAAATMAATVRTPPRVTFGAEPDPAGKFLGSERVLDDTAEASPDSAPAPKTTPSIFARHLWAANGGGGGGGGGSGGNGADGGASGDSAGAHINTTREQSFVTDDEGGEGGEGGGENLRGALDAAMRRVGEKPRRLSQADIVLEGVAATLLRAASPSPNRQTRRLDRVADKF